MSIKKYLVLKANERGYKVKIDKPYFTPWEGYVKSGYVSYVHRQIELYIAGYRARLFVLAHEVGHTFGDTEYPRYCIKQLSVEWEAWNWAEKALQGNISERDMALYRKFRNGCINEYFDTIPQFQTEETNVY